MTLNRTAGRSVDVARGSPPYSLGHLIRYMLKLGTLGFGGPVALVGYMHRDLVERRAWITEGDYKEGLTLAQLMPGPLAAQLAIYLGYCHYGILGASLAGLAFALPSFLMVVALGWVYVRFGGMAWMQSVFYGVGACVIGIIALSALKLSKKTLGRDRLLWVIFGTLAISTIVTEHEIISLIVIGGSATWFVRVWAKRRSIEPDRATIVATGAMIVCGALLAYRLKVTGSAPALLAGASGPESTWGGVLGQIFLFFSQAGAFVFGSGLAIVPFLFGGVVKEFQWLNDQQFMDAVAVAMITPGPVVITTGFIGYLVAGFPGASIAAFATFFPCYLFTILPAPYLRKHGKVPWVLAVVDGLTAAATGAIAGAVVVLAQRSLVDLPTVLIAMASFFLLWKFKSLPEPVLILAAAVLGLVLFPLTQH